MLILNSLVKSVLEFINRNNGISTNSNFANKVVQIYQKTIKKIMIGIKLNIL